MPSLSGALRSRIRELNMAGVDTTELVRAADRLEFIENKEREEHAIEHILNVVVATRDAVWHVRQQEDERHEALVNVITQLRERIEMLDADVQAAVDQIALNTSAEASATAALGLLVAQVAELQAAIEAIPPNAPVDAENRAAILAMTESLKGTLGALTTAIPSNVPPVDPNPPFTPDPALVQAAADALAASDTAAAAAAADPNDAALAQAAADAKAASDAAAAAAADPNAPAGGGGTTSRQFKRRP